MKVRNFMYVPLILLILLGLLGLFDPYQYVQKTSSFVQIPWKDTDNENLKAVIQFTFTSKGGFTTNYPIQAKVEVWFYREGLNDTHVIFHIVNPSFQAFKHPLSDPPEGGLIKISESGFPRKGELNIEFTSPGSYGFAVFSGMLPKLENMTVAYAAQDKEIIRISPYEVRFQNEWTIRGVGLALISLGVGSLAYIKRPKSEELKMRIREDLETIRKEVISNWRNETYQESIYQIDIFHTVQEELKKQVHVKTFRAVQKAYSKIATLNHPSNIPDLNERAHENAIASIDKALDMLK